MECFASSSWTPPVDEPLTGVRSPPPLATFGGVASRHHGSGRLRDAALVNETQSNRGSQIAASLREVEAPPGNIACRKVLTVCPRRPGTIRWPRRFGGMNWPNRPSDGWSDKMQKNRIELAGYWRRNRNFVICRRARRSPMPGLVRATATGTAKARRRLIRTGTAYHSMTTWRTSR